jgi:hypothetical protein
MRVRASSGFKTENEATADSRRVGGHGDDNTLGPLVTNFLVPFLQGTLWLFWTQFSLFLFSLRQQERLQASL